MSRERRPGAILVRDLSNGLEAVVYPEITGTARLGVGVRYAPDLDDEWQYASQQEAVRAALAWDGTGEPTGWYRHRPTGRRRPDGDPAREFVRP